MIYLIYLERLNPSRTSSLTSSATPNLALAELRDVGPVADPTARRGHPKHLEH